MSEKISLDSSDKNSNNRYFHIILISMESASRT